MVRAPFCLAVFLTLFGAGSAASDADRFVVEAKTGQNVLWSATLRFSGDNHCNLLKSVGQSRREIDVSESDCLALKNLMLESQQDGPDRAPSGAVFDEPLYTLHLPKKVVSLQLRAPERCELLRDGAMKCESASLSASEEILILVRTYAKSLP